MHNKQNNSEYISQLRRNIPTELQRLGCWMLSNEDKEPISPHTGIVSDVTNSENWGTFEHCLNALDAKQCYISYVLHSKQPYVTVDLDDKADNPATAKEIKRHLAIIEAFDSYTEKSKSGRGYHIFLKGSIPQSCRRDTVEVYRDARHMVCTGDVYLDKPIAEQQELLNQLLYEMAGQQLNEQRELIEAEPIISDEEVLEMASVRANNKEKFNDLWNGRYEKYPKLYSSPSEADHGLISMLAFYSRSNKQVRRMFRMSELGKRDKAQRDAYINHSLRKFRASQPMEDVDFSSFCPQLKSAQSNEPIQQEPEKQESALKNYEITFPKGLVGDIAQFIYDYSYLPLKEVSLSTAIAFLAGLAGRVYNISGQGLNQYLIVIAGTGVGKDAIHSGMGKLFSSLQMMGGNKFQGANFASGQSITTRLAEHPCFVSVLGEFGLTLQQICAPNASPALKQYKSVLLDIYSKSGKGNSYTGTAYSNKDNDIPKIDSPALTIIGESTPERFYEGLGFDHITEGLIPRLTIVEYRGKRGKANRYKKHEPDQELISHINLIWAKALSNTGTIPSFPSNSVTDVKLTR